MKGSCVPGMRKLFLPLSLVLALSYAMPVRAADEASCEALLTSLDFSHDGSIDAQEVALLASTYQVSLDLRNLIGPREKFMSACLAGNLVRPDPSSLKSDKATTSQN